MVLSVGVSVLVMERVSVNVEDGVGDDDAVICQEGKGVGVGEVSSRILLLS